MNFKALALGTIAAVGTIVAPAPSEAYQVDFDCGHVGGYEACISYQDPSNPDVIYVDGPNGLEEIKVSCYSDGSYEWRSYGPNTKSFNDYIARRFCS